MKSKSLTKEDSLQLQVYIQTTQRIDAQRAFLKAEQERLQLLAQHIERQAKDHQHAQQAWNTDICARYEVTQPQFRYNEDTLCFDIVEIEEPE